MLHFSRHTLRNTGMGRAFGSPSESALMQTLKPYSDMEATSPMPPAIAPQDYEPYLTSNGLDMDELQQADPTLSNPLLRQVL